MVLAPIEIGNIEVMNMDTAIKSMFESLRKLIYRVDAHIGNSGDAHLPATFERAGFLSAEDKGHIDMKCRYAKTLDNGTGNCLTLGMGIYISRSFINAPGGVDDSLCLVEITGAGQGLYKEIKFTWLSAGKQYNRYIYSDIDSGWLDEGWVNLTLLSGFSGYAIAKRTRCGDGFIVDIRYDVQRSTDITANTVIATLPARYTLTQEKPIQETHLAFINNSSQLTPIGFIISDTKDLTLFRVDQVNSISRALGHTIFIR